MSKQASRRTFLRRTTLASTAALGGMAGIFSAKKASAVEPVEREVAAPKYKFTLAGYSYRDLLSGKNPECTLEDFLEDCAEFGLEGTEPTSYYFPPNVNDDYLRRLKALAFRLGLSISSTAVGNNFCLPPGQARDRQIASVKEWIDHAALLGAPVIRIFSGRTGKQQTTDEARRLAIDAIEECCEYAGRHGIFLGLENHGGLTNTAENMLKIVRAVESPWFGAWMDTGNFHVKDVYGELEKIAPYTLHVQVKVATRSPGKGKQPTDYERLAEILDAVDYRGWICLEYEEGQDPRTACLPHIKKLRKAFS